MAYAPQNIDRSGEILAQGINQGFKNIGDFMEKRKEEQKAIKRDADIVRFLAKKDPTLLGDGFDPQTMSERDMAGLLGGIKEHAELGKTVAYQRQVDLQSRKLDQEIRQAEMAGVLTPIQGHQNLWSANNRMYTKDPVSGALIEVGDVPDVMKQNRLSAIGKNKWSGQWNPPMIANGETTTANFGGIAGVDTAAVNQFIQGNTQEAQVEQQRGDALATFLTAIPSGKRVEFDSDLAEYLKLKDKMYEGTQLAKDDMMIAGQHRRTAGNKQFKDSATKLNLLDKKYGGMIGLAAEMKEKQGQVAKPTQKQVSTKSGSKFKVEQE